MNKYLCTDIVCAIYKETVYIVDIITFTSLLYNENIYYTRENIYAIKITVTSVINVDRRV